MNIDRRRFIKGMAAATAAISVTNAFASVLSDVKDVDFIRMYLNKYQLN